MAQCRHVYAYYDPITDIWPSTDMDMPINIQLYTAIWGCIDMDMLMNIQLFTAIWANKDMNILIMSLQEGGGGAVHMHPVLKKPTNISHLGLYDKLGI